MTKDLFLCMIKAGSIIRLGYRLYDASTFEELIITNGLTGGEAYAKLGSPAHGSTDYQWDKNKSCTSADRRTKLETYQVDINK